MKRNIVPAPLIMCRPRGIRCRRPDFNAGAEYDNH